MAKPRIFISHSTNHPPDNPTDQFAKAVCDRLAARLAACGTYAVLRDLERMRPGEPWYPKLNVWLGGCDAAVVLLSPRALASHYVQYEATVLAYRHHSTGRTFPLIPVYLPPVTEAMINETALSASRLTEVQACTLPEGCDDVDRVVGQIEASLERVRRVVTPLDGQIALVGDLLRDVRLEVIDQQVTALDLDLGDWEFPEDGSRRRLAAKLMGAGLEAAYPVLEVLNGWLSDRDSTAIHEIINRVGSSWVPHQTANALLAASKSAESVAARLAETRAANMFLWQALPSLSTVNGVLVARLAAVTGERHHADYVRQLERQIAQALVGVPALGATTAEQALAKLKARAKMGGRPVFVVLPSDGLDGRTIAELKQNPAFAGLMFFVMSAKKPSATFLHAGNVTWLEPIVAEAEERRYCDAHANARAALGYE